MPTDLYWLYEKHMKYKTTQHAFQISTLSDMILFPWFFQKMQIPWLQLVLDTLWVSVDKLKLLCSIPSQFDPLQSSCSIKRLKYRQPLFSGRHFIWVYMNVIWSNLIFWQSYLVKHLFFVLLCPAWHTFVFITHDI